MRDVVVNGVPHVLWEHIFEALLIEHIIVEDLHQHIEKPFILICVKAHLIDLVASFAIRVYCVLISKDVIEDLFYHREA